MVGEGASTRIEMPLLLPQKKYRTGDLVVIRRRPSFDFIKIGGTFACDPFMKLVIGHVCTIVEGSSSYCYYIKACGDTSFHPHFYSGVRTRHVRYKFGVRKEHVLGSVSGYVDTKDGYEVRKVLNQIIKTYREPFTAIYSDSVWVLKEDFEVDE